MGHLHRHWIWPRNILKCQNTISKANGFPRQMRRSHYSCSKYYPSCTSIVEFCAFGWKTTVSLSSSNVKRSRL
ncbi:GPR19 isoform 5 [Pan troglodytes]|uniref:GPR19 isoform 5 n=1 Tax=Pan troglodytes TaxID=9598 RepID=A0A2J8QQC9_PANTR|nr:GPR19 isoform 5 [Pan troglodytes]